jgi:hypothetical protein
MIEGTDMLDNLNPGNNNIQDSNLLVASEDKAAQELRFQISEQKQ